MIRFYNGKVLTMTNGMDISECEVWTDGDKISYVGAKPAEMPKFEREVDLHGNLLMPGFKDAHAHSAMTFVRSYADDLPLQKWLFDKIYPLEARLSGEAVYAFTRLAVLEYLTSGITATYDSYFYNFSNADAIIDTGYRTVMCGAIGKYDANIEKMEDEYVRINKLSPRVGFRLGFHAEYTADDRVIDFVRTMSEKYKAPLSAHSSETALEVAECIERHGLTPTRYFEEQGLLEYGGTFFHCVYMTDEDIEVFKKRGLWVVTNPGSNCKLASGIAPIVKMIDRGLNLSIGTDGPASNNALDMFREMYLTTALQKIAEKDAAACDANDVLKMALVGGGKAMGLDDCDAIAVGKQADMIVIDLFRPNMQPIHNITKNIVYSGSKENVKLTMVAGRILYENGEFFVGDSVERIYAEADREARKIING